MGEKVGFTNCVFEKLFFFFFFFFFFCFLKTLFLLCFQRSTAVAIQTLYVKKNRKLMKNSGLFLNMAKGCFFVCFFFQALMSLCFLSGKVARVLKMFVFFPDFWTLWGGFFLFIWVWKVWLFLFFLFLLFFWCWFCFCVFALFSFVVGCCCFCFCFCFFVFFFCFFGGFKGQVRWPKGPPHLALNPPFFVLFFCLHSFLCFK